MSGVKKRFDRSLYKLYDELAKDATRIYYEGLGLKLQDNPDKYRQDLMCDDYLIECEVKLVWETPEFPYDTVQLPQRKNKFFGRKTQFFIWNKDLTTAATFWSHDIKDLEPVEVPNKYVYKGEYFYQIPLALVTFVTIEHNLLDNRQ
jgi:hypothetical protein